MRTLNALALMLLLLGPARFAQAQTSCRIETAPPLVFGRYDPLSYNDLQAETEIGLRCTGAAQTVGRVAIARDGADGLRVMRRGHAELRWGLYLDAARTLPWGDGLAGTQSRPFLAPGNLPVTLRVYGRIPARQNASVGIYADSVRIRVDW